MEFIYCCKSIIKEIKTSDLIITKANNEQSLVILGKVEYSGKVLDFIMSSNFNKLNYNPTEIFQVKVKTPLKICNNTPFPLM